MLAISTGITLAPIIIVGFLVVAVWALRGMYRADSASRRQRKAARQQQPYEAARHAPIGSADARRQPPAPNPEGPRHR